MDTYLIIKVLYRKHSRYVKEYNKKIAGRFCLKIKASNMPKIQFYFGSVFCSIFFYVLLMYFSIYN